jgi:hypothetical protein
VLAVPIISVLFSSCAVKTRSGTVEQEQLLAAKAVEEYHAHLSERKFERIYDESHESFRQSQPRDKLIKSMEETRERLGAFARVTFSEINVVIGAPMQVRAVYNSAFENGDVTELFTFVDQDQRLQLAYYEVHPGTVKPNAR